MHASDNQKIAAYLDRELPFAEAAVVEQSLSASALENLQAEMNMETALANRLRAPECPDALWRNLRQKMDTAEHPALIHFLQKKYLWLAIAASLVVTVGLYFTRQQPAFLRPVSTVAALQAEAVLEQPETVLAQNGFNLSVGSVPADAHHKMKVLGGYTSRLSGEPVVVICVNCCGQPLRVLVTRKGSRAAKQLIQRGTLQTVVWQGDYQLAVIGEHPANEMLELFKQV